MTQHEHPNATLFREAMDAFNRGDIQGFTDMLADDVEWYEVGSSQPIRGKDAVLASFGGDADFEIEGTVHDVVANDEHTIALIEAVGKRGGRTLNYRTVEIMHVRDGKVTQRWSFAHDTQAVKEFFSSEWARSMG